MYEERLVFNQCKRKETFVFDFAHVFYFIMYEFGSHDLGIDPLLLLPDSDQMSPA